MTCQPRTPLTRRAAPPLAPALTQVGPSWIASWLLAMGWQFAFVLQTPGGMWLAFLLILGALLAMGHGLMQMYRWGRRVCGFALVLCVGVGGWMGGREYGPEAAA